MAFSSSWLPFVFIVLLISVGSCGDVFDEDVDCTKFNGDNDSCSDCSQHSQCYWCYNSTEDRTIGSCGFLADFEPDACPAGFCSGDNCLCQEELCTNYWPCSPSIFGQIVLMAFYGVILAAGAKTISDGSELLMEILDPGIVGGFVLPVLGAVPDAMIIIVSGAFGDDPQEQLAVGVGTLAGSTIMLLTIPYGIGMILARCDIMGGEAVDNVNTRPITDIHNTGITVDEDTPTNARIMIVTSFSYLIVQSVAFAYLNDEEAGMALEDKFSLAGFLICIIFFVLYSVYQVMNPKLQERKIEEAKMENMRRTAVLRMKLMLDRQADSMEAGIPVNPSIQETGPHEQTPLLPADPPLNKSFAEAVDIPDYDKRELDPVHVDIGEMGLYWKAKAEEALKEDGVEIDVGGDEEEEGGDGSESPKDIAIRSAVLLLIGTGLVVVFSDPMVDVIGDFGNSIHISPFYVSFVVTPLCSNASELISSLIFASRKRRKNSSLTYSALYGAATMNNTLCLGIFYALIYFRSLEWDFSSETLSILVVILAVGIPGSLMTTFKIYWSPIVLSLYPLSILLVYLLDTYAGWQ
uniref:Sodium/calcium exchanger membrane region domain-containing protein n=1 Tax=Paramoeba aestuarina TaxID=180227 RepID=A0A7S4JKE2_9EUKA